MSYEIAKSITKRGDKISIISASNNVFPRKYYHSEIPFHEDGFKVLAKCLVEGSIQPQPSANNYRWCGVVEELEKTPEDNWAEVILERLCSTEKTRAKYYVGVFPTNGIERYIVKRGKTFHATLDKKDATPMPYYQAKWFVDKHPHYSPRMFKADR